MISSKRQHRRFRSRRWTFRHSMYKFNPHQVRTTLLTGFPTFSRALWCRQRIPRSLMHPIFLRETTQRTCHNGLFSSNNMLYHNSKISISSKTLSSRRFSPHLDLFCNSNKYSQAFKCPHCRATVHRSSHSRASGSTRHHPHQSWVSKWQISTSQSASKYPSG
jgi:predicted RNA-binding Zn-ribbon protein involved in translation (DUF1610 family)